MDQQLRAMGTTVRYALAGLTVYGPIAGIKRLSEVEAKLGDIDSLAQRMTNQGTMPLLRSQMNELADAALDISTRVAQPMTDIEDMFTSLYSALSDPLPIQNVRNLAMEIGKLSRVSKGGGTAATPDELISAMLGEAAAFMPNQSQAAQAAAVPKFAALFRFILQNSRSIGGHELANGMGGIISTSRIANINPEQMSSLIIGSMMAGGSANVNLRGVRALLQTITTPRPSNYAAYRSAGLPTNPDELRQIGGFGILIRMAESIRQRGGLGVSRLSNDQLDEIANNPDTPVSQLGITERKPGMGAAQLITGFTSQAYAQRQLATLSTFIDQIRGLNKEAQNTPKIMRDYQDAFDRAMSHTRLQQAAVATQNLGTALLLHSEPFISGIAGAETAVVRGMAHHPHLAQAGIAGMIALGLGGRTRMGRAALSKIPGIGRILANSPRAAVNTALAAEAAPAVLSGIGTGSRSQPFWVIIHPDSWAMAPDMGGGHGGGGGGGNGKSWPSWAKKLAPVGAAAVVAAPFAFAAGDFYNSSVRHGSTALNAATTRRPGESIAEFLHRVIPTSSLGAREDWQSAIRRSGFDPRRISVTGDAAKDIKMTMFDALGNMLKMEQNGGGLTLSKVASGQAFKFPRDAVNAANNALNPLGQGPMELHLDAKGKLVLDLELSDNAKQQLGLKGKRAHIQVQAWPQVRPKAGGKPRNRRSGH